MADTLQKHVTKYNVAAKFQVIYQESSRDKSKKKMTLNHRKNFSSLVTKRTLQEMINKFICEAFLENILKLCRVRVYKARFSASHNMKEVFYLSFIIYILKKLKLMP